MLGIKKKKKEEDLEYDEYGDEEEEEYEEEEEEEEEVPKLSKMRIPKPAKLGRTIPKRKKVVEEPQFGIVFQQEQFALVDKDTEEVYDLKGVQPGLAQLLAKMMNDISAIKQGVVE